MWEYILNDDPEVMASWMDHKSVQTGELLCPRASEDDGRVVKRSVIGKCLHKQQRRLLRRRLLQIDTLIPSFRSLFEDLNYLELLVKTLKRLRRPTASERSLGSSFSSSCHRCSICRWDMERAVPLLHAQSPQSTCISPRLELR